MKNQIILIIDNDNKFINDLGDELKQAGYTTVSALRLGDVLEKVINQQIVLIIVNIELFDDCDMVSSIRKIDKNIPIITITGNDSLEVQKKVRQEGIFFYFVKPFTIEDMNIVVQSAIKSRKP